MSDFEAMAARLFPTSAPAPEVPAALPAAEPVTAQPEAPAPAEQSQEAAPQTEQTANELPANELPDAIRELRDDPLRRMFSPQGTFASVPLEDAFADVAVDPEVKAAAAHEYREIFEDLQASPQDANELVTAARAFHAEPMTPERDASNVNAAMDALNRQYGKEAPAALAAAQRMINRDPRLAAMLDRTRLGNDPKTVLKVVALARSQRQR